MKASKACISALTLGLAILTGGCGDSATGGAGGASSSSTTTTSGAANGGGGSAANGGGGAGASGGMGGGGGSATPTVEEVVKFDPSKGELPEGLIVVGADARVGFAPTGGVVSVPLAGGAATPFASLPPPPPNTSLMTGLTVDAAGAIYGALVSFTADAQPGVYKAPAAGGAATLFASDPGMIFPNGFAWTDDGNLFVADSAYGGVFKVSPDGTTTSWLQDDSLAGDPTACGGAATDLSIGANGIVRKGQAFYVSSTNKGVLVKVPIAADGTAGAVTVIAGPDCAIAGIDGIALDDDGTVIGAINKQNKLVRIDASGGITTLVDGGKLDFPASLAFAGTGKDRALYVTSFAYLSATTGGTPHPSLLRVHLAP
jgi:sugar lactone lactonase YvrE